MRRSASEHSTLEIPLPAPTFRFLCEHFSKALDVVPTATPGSYRIRTKSSVGSIVAPEFELHIRPKCGTRNLFYLLGYAYRLADIRKEMVSHEKIDDIREFLVRILVGRLEGLLRLGLRRNYVEYREDSPSLRGRLLLERHLRRLPGCDLTLPCQFEEFTPDVVHNRVVRYTLEGMVPPANPRLAGRLMRVRRSFRIVGLQAFRPADIEGLVYDRLNEHYRPVHQLCRLFLESSGLEQDQGPHPLSSFLIDMDKVFEQFVAGWLRDNLPPGLTLSAQSSGHLDRSDQISIRPDLVLGSEDELISVADTKYKVATGGKPDPSDAYQILAYCRALGLREGVLIYPDEFPGPTRFSTMDGENVITSFGIPLAGSIEEIEDRLRGLASYLTRNRRLTNVA